MLKLSDDPATVDPAHVEGSGGEHVLDAVDNVQGDPELAGMLDTIRSLLDAESLALRLVSSRSDLGPILAGVGRTIDAGFTGKLAHAASIPAGGVWLPGDSGGNAVHVSILQPRASDRIALLCRPMRGGMFDRRQFERQLSLYLPLIERTIAQWAHAHVERLRRREEHAVFDTFGFGLLIIDTECRIQMANSAADAMLGAPGVLSGKDGRLAILHVEDAMRFQVSLRHVLGDADNADAPIIVTISRSNDLPLLLTLRALPVSGEGPRLAVVEITDPRAARDLPLESLSRHFDLTQSERRLIEQLVHGKTLGEAAIAMRLKEQTARTYLKQIFQKTGLRRQVELIQHGTRRYHARPLRRLIAPVARAACRQIFFGIAGI